MQQLQLNHVALHVADVAESCRFYQQVLQLQPMQRPAFDFPGAWFRLGEDQELHLIGGRSEPVQAGNRGNHFALLVDDIEAWNQQVTEQAQVVQPLKQRPDGAWQVFVADPDGYVVELCMVPLDP